MNTRRHTVQVTAAPPAVEVERTVQSNTYEERTVRAVPTVGDDHPAERRPPRHPRHQHRRLHDDLPRAHTHRAQ